MGTLPKGGNTSDWGLIVTAPIGMAIGPGTYDTTQGGTATTYAFDFFGDGRGCNGATGHLVINEIAFTPDLQTLQHFRASFEYHCGGGTAALRGQVAILADPWR